MPKNGREGDEVRVSDTGGAIGMPGGTIECGC